MSELRQCDAHGFHEGDSCPVCDATGRPVLSGDRRRRLSKFVSGALRHFPDDAGLDLDAWGWTDAEAVVAAVEAKYDWADRDALAAVVATDPKGRFEVDSPRASDDSLAERPDSRAERPHGRAVLPDGARLRAAYGHSVDVDLEAGEGPVPDELFHGTSPGALEAIREEGIRPMSRQLVHLSGTVTTAREVGARHADEPVVLRIDAASMQADGHRITRRGREVYTTERVPPTYLSVLDEES